MKFKFSIGTLLLLSTDLAIGAALQTNLDETSFYGASSHRRGAISHHQTLAFIASWVSLVALMLIGMVLSTVLTNAQPPIQSFSVAYFGLTPLSVWVVENNLSVQFAADESIKWLWL